MGWANHLGSGPFLSFPDHLDLQYHDSVFGFDDVVIGDGDGEGDGLGMMLAVVMVIGVLLSLLLRMMTESNYHCVGLVGYGDGRIWGGTGRGLGGWWW